MRRFINSRSVMFAALTAISTSVAAIDELNPEQREPGAQSTHRQVGKKASRAYNDARTACDKKPTADRAQCRKDADAMYKKNGSSAGKPSSDSSARTK